MCRWNPDSKHPFRRCRHGHRDHEALYSQIIPSQPPVIWCNECWTVCAFWSSQKVYKGLRAWISDIVYSPVHQTGELLQPYPDQVYPQQPSIQRYQTFGAFNQARYSRYTPQPMPREHPYSLASQ